MNKPTNKQSTTAASTAARAGDLDDRVIGALMGTQSGRCVEIHTSFELTYTVTKDDQATVVINTDYLRNKMNQYAQVFPKYEVLGWYSTGNGIRPTDYITHRQIMEFNENPLYVVCGTAISAMIKELPVFVFESVINIANDAVQLSFASVNYKIQSEESERISVDHVAHIQDFSGKAESSHLVPHLNSLYNAVKMLNTRICFILRYLEATKQNQIPVDHQLLREISSLCNRLPTVDSQKFNVEFQNELNDSSLITYMATMTRETTQLNELIDKFNVISEKSRRRGLF